MTIVLGGGGSGGHITPLLAVARELRADGKAYKIVYVGEKRGKFSHIAEESGLFDECRYIYAGKLRRYHNEPLLKRLIDLKTIYFNTRDLFRLIAGSIQSIFLFRRLRPSSVLLKGGYVCVPASIGAKFAKAYIVTHDSDALPGLSNRFAARYASVHATAMPEQYYNYPKKTVKHVGLPVDSRNKRYSADEVRFLKEKFKLPQKSKVLLVTGGSNGARRLNAWCLKALDQLFAEHPDLYVFMLAGKGNLSQVKKHGFRDDINRRLIAEEFTAELFHLSAISDVIIARAGATTIAEFAAGSKAVILVPNPDLTGGHQLKNAQVYEDQGSAVVVQETELQQSVAPLIEAVNMLINDSQKRGILGERLNASLPSIPAAKAIADILVNGAGR